VDNVRELAISGPAGNVGKIFRYVDGGWEDTSAYSGWISCTLVADIQFSPSWETDNTIVAVTVSAANADLQTGTWGDTPVWKTKNIVTGKTLTTEPGLAPAGVTLPTLDPRYSGTKADTRWVWVWVNYADGTGEIYYVKGDNKNPIGMQIEGKPWLTNVSYWGTTAAGSAIAGLWDPEGNCGEGSQCMDVQVYRIKSIKNMDLCGTCEPWVEACKPPTGAGAMAAFYVSTGKAYAVPLGPDDYYDEGAWSVSFEVGDKDVGEDWNQLSLIDTKIDYLSDVAVSPDCNKTMLVSVNKVDISYCGCDSVWLKAVNLPEASEYSGKWLRTWSGRLTGVNTDVQNFGDYEFDFPERGLLRLAPEETTGENVYLVDLGTKTVYWNDLETLDCWEKGTATVEHIVDLAVKDKTTIYALGDNGDVAMSDNSAVDWHKVLDSKVDEGWTIAVHGQDILVGGMDGDVSYSDDGGGNFTVLEEFPTIDGLVTVAFDSYFDQNNTIYAALANAGSKNGIYRWVIDTSKEWKNLTAQPFDYTGLVLGRNPGNPKTSKDTGGVLYASYVGHTYGSNWSSSDDFFDCWKGNAKDYYTGVARTLTPAADISCEKCIEWDYLTAGLTTNEHFVMAPYALKACGCIDATTNTKLFAIDGRTYDMTKAKDGTVWTFEDCYAKKAPVLTSPANNTTIPAETSCRNLPFTIKWDGLCDACYYDVQVALDNQFTDVVAQWDYQEGGRDILGATSLSYVVPSVLTCQLTYYWRVRAHEASTCQIIHSWWSDTGTITVAPSAEQGAVHMGGPASGAQGVGTKNVGFTWDLPAGADRYDWVLSKNADLSNPVESKTGLTSPAYTTTKTLEYGTTYYWQVKAYKGGTLISTSPTGTFTTAPTGAFCCPIDGLCFDTQDLLKAHTADAHPAPGTPFWVWIVIAIGAVLVIVVIVLIFRTRRV
jgi:hypothetical protein